MEFDALPRGSPNPQVIYEVDFESLFGPLETAFYLESRSRPFSFSNPPVSQNISGPTIAFPPLESEIFVSQIKGENAYTSMPQGKGGIPILKSNANGFQDATNQFAEIHPIPNNNDDDANFFDFPNDDNAGISVFEVQAEYHPQIQIV